MNVSMKTFEYVALKFLIINLSTQWKTKSWSLCNWDKAAWGYAIVVSGATLTCTTSLPY